GRVRTRRAPDGRLVDVHYLVEVLGALHPVVGARPFLGPVEHLGEGAVQDVVDQGRFARTRYTRHTGERPEGNAHRHALQVVLPRVVDDDELTVTLAPPGRPRDLQDPREVSSGQRRRVGGDLIRGAGSDHVATELSGSGPEIDHEV